MTILVARSWIAQQPQSYPQVLQVITHDQQGASFGMFYLSAEIQLVYSTVPANRMVKSLKVNKKEI